MAQDLTLYLLGAVSVLTTFSFCCEQVCSVHGKKNWCQSLCSSRRSCGGEAKDGHDRVCLLDGQRNEASIKGIIHVKKKKKPKMQQKPNLPPWVHE